MPFMWHLFHKDKVQDFNCLFWRNNSFPGQLLGKLFVKNSLLLLDLYYLVEIMFLFFEMVWICFFLPRLNVKTCGVASPVVLRMFLTSIFINVDVSVREGQIYCDKLCDQGPYSKGQVSKSLVLSCHGNTIVKIFLDVKWLPDVKTYLARSTELFLRFK